MNSVDQEKDTKGKMQLLASQSEDFSADVLPKDTLNGNGSVDEKSDDLNCNAGGFPFVVSLLFAVLMLKIKRFHL